MTDEELIADWLTRNTVTVCPPYMPGRYVPPPPSQPEIAPNRIRDAMDRREKVSTYADGTKTIGEICALVRADDHTVFNDLLWLKRNGKPHRFKKVGMSGIARRAFVRGAYA